MLYFRGWQQDGSAERRLLSQGCPHPRVSGQGEGRGRPAEPAQSARGRLEMGRRWSDQRHLNQVQLVFGSSAGVAPFLSGQLWELWQLMLRLQSAHQVVNLSIWGGGFSIHKTACGTRLRMLSTALEEKLKVLDFAY